MKSLPEWLNPVPRETVLRLQQYQKIVERWQPAINLISDPAHLWERHIIDSAQLFLYLPDSIKILVDFGSGGGFPGLILAIMGVSEIHLIESDRRKTIFLKEAARELECPHVTVHHQRIEEALPILADAVTARALAPLPQLCEWALPYLKPDAFCLFPKGKKHIIEIEEARKNWNFDLTTTPSRTDAEGVILTLRHLGKLP